MKDISTNSIAIFSRYKDMKSGRHPETVRRTPIIILNINPVIHNDRISNIFGFSPNKRPAAVTKLLLPFTNYRNLMRADKDFTDQSLIQSLRSDANPDAAIRHLYRTQFRITAAYIKQNSGTEEDAEDIFQELVLVFIDILKKDKFRGDSSVSTFLYALTRNIWLNELNRRGKSQRREEIFEKGKDKEDLDVSHLIADRETKMQLMRVVDKLGETCKKILLAFYFENLAMREILQFLNYENEQVVRNKKYKCLKQLEQMIMVEPNLVKNLKSSLL